MRLTAFAALMFVAIVASQPASSETAQDRAWARLFTPSVAPGRTLDLDEFRKGMDTDFRMLDTDDGRLTQADADLQYKLWRADGHAYAAREMLSRDLDADGVVTLEEVETVAAFGLHFHPDARRLRRRIDEFMKFYDPDGDGRVPIEEGRALIFKGWAATDPHLKSDLVVQALLLDSDNDGAITPAEFMRAAEAAFRSADTNGDGSVSADEAKAFREHPPSFEKAMARSTAEPEP